MEVMRATIKNVQEVSGLFNAYRMFYEQPSNLLKATEFIQARIENNDSVIFLAIENEKAIGFVQLYPTFTSVGMQKAYILNDLFVDPTSRSKGVGKALLQVVFQFCKDKGGKFVTLETAPNNHAAKALYENMGMQINSEYEHYIKYV